MIRFACPACKTTVSVSDQQVGTKVRCPSCTQKIRVPSPTADKTLMGDELRFSDLNLPPSLPLPAPLPAFASAPPPSQTSPQIKWFMMDNGQQRGPFTHASLVQLAFIGKLKPADMVRQDGSSSWLKATIIPGLFPQQLATSTHQSVPIATLVQPHHAISVPPPSAIPIQAPSVPPLPKKIRPMSQSAIGCGAAVLLVGVGGLCGWAGVPVLMVIMALAGVGLGTYFMAQLDAAMKAKQEPEKLAPQRLTKTEHEDETIQTKKSHAGEAAGGGVGIIVLLFLAWLWIRHDGAIPGGGQLVIPNISETTTMPPIDIDPSVNEFFVFSDWRGERRRLYQITCRIKANTTIQPGLGNITPVAEFYDKDGVRLDEEMFLIPSTMISGEVIEKSIYISPDKFQRTTRIKLRIKRSVF